MEAEEEKRHFSQEEGAVWNWSGKSWINRGGKKIENK